MATLLFMLAPSVLLVAAFFAAPLALFLFRSIDNVEVPRGLPRTAAAIADWDGKDLPAEPVYRALLADLAALRDTPELPVLGRRLNHEQPGFRSMLVRSAGRVRTLDVPSAREHLLAIDARWGDPAFIRVLWLERHRLTPFYMLAAMDLRRGADGGIERARSDDTLFVELFGRTVWISAAVTAICLVLGFPVALLMAGSTPAMTNAIFLLVLIPFWTSLLVRSTAWVILLQNEGLVNQALVWSGILSAPVKLIFNRIGLYVAMVHVLLPFMILPLYSVLKSIPPELMRAAASLGARPSEAFRRVYLPQAMPGIIAGSTLVFVLALGYYITPALVGGPGDQMIGYFIAYFTNSAINWGMASALGTLLLAAVAIIYAVVGRTVGFERLQPR